MKNYCGDVWFCGRNNEIVVLKNAHCLDLFYCIFGIHSFLSEEIGRKIECKIKCKIECVFSAFKFMFILFKMFWFDPVEIGIKCSVFVVLVVFCSFLRIF